MRPTINRIMQYTGSANRFREFIAVRLNDLARGCQVCSRFGMRHACTCPHCGRCSYAAFLAGCAFLPRDLAVVFLFPPVSSKLFCRTETKSITLVGLGAFFGFSSSAL